MDLDVSDIVAKALPLLQPYVKDKKYTYAYFEPDSRYCDSWVRGHRRGAGFLGFGRPAASAPFISFDICIGFRPGVLREEWDAYTIGVDYVAGKPTVAGISRWPQSGGEEFAPEELIEVLRPHILALLECRTRADEPPREAPDGMF